MTYKLTIDNNLLENEASIPAMAVLKRWMSEGKIELIDARAVRTESSFAPVSIEDARSMKRERLIRRSRAISAGVVTFRSVAGIIFPNRDSQKLSMAEINDVAHLMKHHTSKNELFVTENASAFIEAGKREKLKESLGIIALTSAEAVKMLSEIEGWK